MRHVVPQHAIVNDDLREVIVLFPHTAIVTLLFPGIARLSIFEKMDDLSRRKKLDVAIWALGDRVLIEVNNGFI